MFSNAAKNVKQDLKFPPVRILCQANSETSSHRIAYCISGENSQLLSDVTITDNYSLTRTSHKGQQLTKSIMKIIIVIFTVGMLFQAKTTQARKVTLKDC